MLHVRRTSALAEACGLLLTLTIVYSVAAYSETPDGDSATTLGSTVPANGDVNPYGIARVPRTMGRLVEGRFLVSNFNNAANEQGTGTTIVQMQPNGAMELFAWIDASKVSCPGGIGLTTALVVMRNGFVVLGSLPTTDGTSATSKAGCLIVLNSNGKVVETISGHHINGPWDMTGIEDNGAFVLFVTNVLNGTVSAGGKIVNRGTVVRMFFTVPTSGPPVLKDSAVIADGFPERTDPAALVIGPTGVAFNPSTGNLFVADSLDNRIAVIHHALVRTSATWKGATVFKGGKLNDPLGVSLVGHMLFVANGDDGNIITIDTSMGTQVDVDLVDASGSPPGSGALFGLWAVNGSEIYFVDDATNTLNLLH